MNSEQKVPTDAFNRRYLFEMWPGVGKGWGVHEYVDIMCSFLRLPVDTLNDDFLRVLVSEQKSFMQFPSNVVHAFVVSEDPLGNSLSDLPD